MSFTSFKILFRRFWALSDKRRRIRRVNKKRSLIGFRPVNLNAKKLYRQEGRMLKLKKEKMTLKRVIKPIKSIKGIGSVQKGQNIVLLGLLHAQMCRMQITRPSYNKNLNILKILTGSPDRVCGVAIVINQTCKAGFSYFF